MVSGRQVGIHGLKGLGGNLHGETEPAPAVLQHLPSRGAQARGLVVLLVVLVEGLRASQPDVEGDEDGQQQGTDVGRNDRVQRVDPSLEVEVLAVGSIFGDGAVLQCDEPVALRQALARLFKLRAALAQPQLIFLQRVRVLQNKAAKTGRVFQCPFFSLSNFEKSLYYGVVSFGQVSADGVDDGFIFHFLHGVFAKPFSVDTNTVRL